MYSKLSLLYVHMYSLFFRFVYTTSFEMTIFHHGSLNTLYPLSHPHLGTQHLVPTVTSPPSQHLTPPLTSPPGNRKPATGCYSSSSFHSKTGDVVPVVRIAGETLSFYTLAGGKQLLLNLQSGKMTTEHPTSL